MFKKILNWFKKPKIEQESTPPKTLRDVDFFDTVWIVDRDGVSYEGWIYDKSKKHIVATAVDPAGVYRDFRFVITHNDLQKLYIEQNHIKIYFDYKCWLEK